MCLCAFVPLVLNSNTKTCNIIMAKRYLLIVFISASLAAIGFRVAFFIISVNHVPASADESIVSLQAQQIARVSSSPVSRAIHPRPILGRFPMLFMAQPYLFPIESYISAPFVRWLPRNAFGVRIIPAILGFLSIICLLLIMRRYGRLKDIWPGVLLALFPSTYLLMLQTAYALPGYSSLMLLSVLVILLAQIHNECSKYTCLVISAMASGFFAGLACSGTLMAVPVLLTAGAMVCLSTRWSRALVSFPVFSFSALTGMLPYFIAKRAYPGAHEAVSSLYSWHEAIACLWSPALNYTLPTAMGIRSCIFPDTKEAIALIPYMETIFAVLWVFLVAAAAVMCIHYFIVRLIHDKWPSFKTIDLFVGLSWIGLALFILSTRSHSHTYRYLLLLALCFPLIIGWLYTKSGKFLRVLLGIFAIFIAGLNIANCCMLMDRWSTSNFAASTVKLYEPQPAVDYLRKKGVDRCYATYWNAYRIDYLTDEQIVCSQPYNERFFGWPVPYKEIVDSSTNAAYVLSPGFRFLPDQFEDDLAVMQVAYHKQLCGDFSVYTDFKRVLQRTEQKIYPSLLTISVSIYPEAASVLNDGNYATRWRSHKAQEKGMWVNVQLPSSMPITRVSMYYNYYHHDRARSLNILAHTMDGWKTVRPDITRDMDPFEFINSHPIYGNQVQTIRFTPVITDLLKIEINEPEPGRDWTIGEIELYKVAVPGKTPVEK